MVTWLTRASLFLACRGTFAVGVAFLISFNIQYTIKAQTLPGGVLSNLRSKTFLYSEDPVLIESDQAVIYLYGIVNGDTLWLENPFFQVHRDSIFFQKSFSEKYPNQKLELKYRVLNDSQRRIFQRLDASLMQAMPTGDYIGFSLQDPDLKTSGPRADMSGLQYSGSFSRGISVGNRQSLVLNAGLNLQLSGQITENVQLKAAISDNQIPIQPEGNTQQLQEFDRIFIELSSGSRYLRAGDFELNKPDSWFLNYFKRAQGVLAGSEDSLANGWKVKSEGSFAISKGKFRRQFITPLEGNQGPYRLLGNDGETFIIVLANTEKVYVDGQLLRRGLEMDYVIDYNRGEITFTSRRLVTKELRVIVEFEYADQQYLRSLYHVKSSLETENASIRIAVFSEQDNANVPGNQLLRDEDKRLLSTLGDRIDQAVISSIRDAAPSDNLSNPLLYAQVDTTLMDGRTFMGILRYTPSGGPDLKVATFLDVGEGQGNYVVAANLANGRVFEWIAPDQVTGKPRGRFEPSIRIVTPRLQRMVTLGGDWQVKKNHTLSGEAAWSTLDVNRFSSLDAANDQGLAAMIRYQGKLEVGAPTSKWSIRPYATFEHKGADFRSINPYRNQEFNRDWNISNDTLFIREALWTGGVALNWKQAHQLEYELTGFDQSGFYRGMRHSYKLTSGIGKTQVSFFGSEMESKSLTGRSTFSRPRLDIRQQLGKWEMSLYGERDRSSQLDTFDQLTSGSFGWDIVRLQLKSPDYQRWSSQISYSARADYTPLNGEFTTFTTAQEWRAEGQLRTGKQGRLNGNVIVRDLEVTDFQQTTIRPIQTYLARINYQESLLKNSLRWSTSYELGSGQDPRLQFVYLEVRPGEGQYIWIDRNVDGVQQLDEFELAPFPDQANFVRIATLTSDFIRTDNMLFNYQLFWDPGSWWRSEKGMKKFLSRFSFQSNMNALRKSQQGSIQSYWYPFTLDFSDTAVINGNRLNRQSIFFNRANPTFELQFHSIQQGSRLWLTSGFERRGQREEQYVLRINPARFWSLQSTVTQFTRQNKAEAFATRDYELKGWDAKQEFSVQVQQGWRLTGKSRWQQVKNMLGEIGEQANIGELGIQNTINRSGSYSLRSEFTYIQVRFEGDANTAVAFAMLEGLQNGRNLLWNITFERTLLNNVQLLLGYEGRKTGLATTVHVAKVQMKATF